jgi:hypothetical protein
MHAHPRTWLALPLLVLAGCATNWNDPAALERTRVQPLGPNEYLVFCSDSPRFCDEPAKQSCPNGFDVTHRSVDPAAYGRTTLRIKCH